MSAKTPVDKTIIPIIRLVIGIDTETADTHIDLQLQPGMKDILTADDLADVLEHSASRMVAELRAEGLA